MIKYFLQKLYKAYKEAIKEPQAILVNMPKQYEIEPINFCNLKCPSCSTLFIKDKKFLKTDEFVEIIKEIPEFSSINLYHYGEPFLNPNIFDIIKEGKKKNLYLSIHSNMNFKEKLIPLIVDSGLDHLTASMDGASNESYSKYRVNGDFNVAWRNFSELAKLRFEKGGSPKSLQWQFIVNKYNEHEIPKAKQMIKELPGDPSIYFLQMGFRQYLVEFERYSESELDEILNEWLPKNKKYINPYFLNPEQGYVSDPTICFFLWNAMYISVDGDVFPCCHTYKKEHSFGNLKNQSLSDIWNNDNYVNSRRMFLEPDFKECNTICSRCDNFLRLGKGNIISRHWRFLKWLARKAKEKRYLWDY
mgnify:CR=1 FL=1